MREIPGRGTLNLTDGFAQDTLSLAASLKLILGLKLEDDPYSHLSPLPNVRLSWKLSEDSLLWSAVSRAIRSPTPFDRDVAEYLAGTLLIVGGPDFKPEQLTAYEAGYRATLGPALSLSASLYYNWYDDLRSLEYAPNGQVLPLRWGNMMEGDTYGTEIWGDYQALAWWRLSFGINELREDLRFLPGSSGLLETRFTR